MQDVRSQIPPRYEIREELYRSEQNVRLRAFDTVLQQEVVLEYSGTGARQFERRSMLRQARMRAKIRHPKIQPLKEILETPLSIVHVLEPSPGETLEAVLAGMMHMEPEDVIDLGIDLADALHALHAEGVVHRAVSAENILVNGPGKLSVVTGFAFAKPIEGMGQSSLQYSPSKKDSSRAKALPHHPAPEQVAGQAADARSDVFALGCVLYQCMTGNRAFDDHGAAWQEPAHPNPAGSKLAPGLAEIIMKCLRHSPMSRYQTMLDVGEALQKLKEKASTATSRKPHYGPWIAMAAALVLAATIYFAMDGFRNPTPQNNGRATAGRPSVTTPRFEDHYTGAHALLIATNYRGTQFGPELKNAERDIAAIRERLLKLGWEAKNIKVLKGDQATHANIRQAIRDLVNMEGVRDDQVFVYYAGHGVDVQSNLLSSGALIPHDGIPADKQKREKVGKNWIHFSALRQLFDCDAKHILVALDCCHSGAAMDVMRGRPAPKRETKFRRETLRDMCHHMIVSCSADERAMDGNEGHSPFAVGFLKALDRAAKEGPVSTTGILNYIEEKLDDVQRCYGRNISDTTGLFYFQKR